MRGTQFQELVDMVRDEAKLSTDTSKGVQNEKRIKRLINRVYETLWDDHEWEFAKIEREDAYKQMAAGQRFYDFPAQIREGDAVSAWVNVGDDWIPLDYGVDWRQYAIHDSEKDVRADPPQRWVARDKNQFEVWPLPASNVHKIAFEGRKSFTRLVANEDVCLLDDQVIVLFVAADLLEGNKQGDAQTKREMAQARLDSITKRSSDKTRVRMGLADPTIPQSGFPRIRVAYAR